MTTDAEQDAGQTDGEEYVDGPAVAATPARAEQPMTADAAKAQISVLQNNRAWMAEYLGSGGRAGDKAKGDEMDRLYRAAYPEQPGAAPASDGLIGRQGSASAETDESFQPPRDPSAYDFKALQGEDPTSADFALQREFKSALHAEGIPKFAVEVAVKEIARLTEAGMPDDAALERSKATCLAQLELRHGSQAREILAAAGKVFKRLEARDERIADLLCASGAGNSAWLIETLAQLPGR